MKRFSSIMIFFFLKRHAFRCNESTPTGTQAVSVKAVAVDVPVLAIVSHLHPGHDQLCVYMHFKWFDSLGFMSRLWGQSCLSFGL